MAPARTSLKMEYVTSFVAQAGDDRESRSRGRKRKVLFMDASNSLSGLKFWHSRESGNRAPESAFGQRGGSPLQVRPLRPVTDCNCVAARRGGEQQEVNDQSAG